MEFAMEDNLEDMLNQLLIYDPEKAAKAKAIVKAKVVCTNSLLKRFYQTKMLNKELQSSTINIKESYKQSCIDRMELREKYEALQEAINKSQAENKETEEKCIAAVNQFEGIRAHSKQLELLIKENETTIEALKIENSLERSTSKEFEKKCTTLQKEYDFLIKNISVIRDVIFGKKKVTKDIKSFLNKYGKLDDSQDDNSSDETDAFEDCLSPLSESVYASSLGSPTENNKAVELQSIDIIKDNIINRDDNDSQSSTEIVSSDTGRGSSLAYSDSDKCSVLSPEYFAHHSPPEVRSNKDDKIVAGVDAGLLLTRQFACVATSPIIFEESLAQMDTAVPAADIAHEARKSTPSAPTMVDRIVSPIFITTHVDTATNTEKYIHNDVATSPLNIGNRTPSCIDASDHNIEEQECLDINNSTNLIDESSNDGEIQMIFDTMRFNAKLITPIPTTPAKTRSEVGKSVASQTLLDVPDVVRKEDLAPIFAQIAMLQQELQNVKSACERSTISLEAVISARAQQKQKDSYLMKVDKEMNTSDMLLEPEATLVRQNVDSYMGIDGIQKIVNFKRKLSKIKDLFDDSSPPRPCDDILLQPSITALSHSPMAPSPLMLSTSPVSHSPEKPTMFLSSEISRPNSTPPPSPQPVSPTRASPRPMSPSFMSPVPVSPPTSPISVSPSPTSPISISPTPTSPIPVSPTPTSPIPVSPTPASPIPVSPTLTSPTLVSPPPTSLLPSPAAADGNNPNNNNSFKSKERLRFEDYPLKQDALSDDGISDHDISLPVVVELAPDCHEIDIGILHKIVEEKQRQLDQEIQAQETLKEIKNTKPKTLTKLEKLRQNMTPKSKIKKSNLQTKSPRAKLRIQPKRLTANKERILRSDVIDPKAAYENARKIMAELKSKEEVSSKVIVNDQMLKTPKKASRRCSVKSPKQSSPHNESKSRESTVGQQKVSPLLLPNTKPQKDCACESRSNSHCFGKDNVKITSPKPVKTSISTNESCNVSPSGLKKTRNLSKRNEENDAVKEYNSEVTNFNNNHLTSPSLRSYTKKRIAHKVEPKCINNNNNPLTESYVVDQILSKRDSDLFESENRKGLKRPSFEELNDVPKRKMRSTSINKSRLEADNTESVPDPSVEKAKNQTGTHQDIITYDDLELFDNMKSNKTGPKQPQTNINRGPLTNTRNSNNGILCVFLDKYSSYNVKKNLKISENVVNTICKQLEDSIGSIQNLPPTDHKKAMDKLVKELLNHPSKHVVAALIKFLKEPARKIESYNKICTPPAPPMTKVEVILLYIVPQLNSSWPNFMRDVFDYIEYTLFLLNRSPEFDHIETLSHFYAVLCRYNKDRDRLRLFIIDAMYCLNFKAVPLIKQCLDVWMHILPLAHMGMAKSPLVKCVVYLLHFFKCEDRFNRVQDIRNILHRKYFYKLSEWNETGMLETFRNSIKELRDNPIEKKMLRLALIILAKRNGARWCQTNIIKNMLQPIIEEAGVPDTTKHFCVAMLGPLVRPYPVDMKVNCEIIMNQLFDMLKQNQSSKMQEAIFTSLICMSRHDQHRVIRALLCWTPDNISKDFEDTLKTYVKERSVKSWKQVLAKIFVRE